jgi:hypothetical protein
LEITSVDWLGIAAAAAAASAAWLRTKDHVTLRRAYSVTAHELELAKASAPSFTAGDPAAEGIGPRSSTIRSRPSHVSTTCGSAGAARGATPNETPSLSSLAGGRKRRYDAPDNAL